MMCLFADLSLYCGTRRHRCTELAIPNESHCAALTRADFLRECSNICDLYRDSRSNPMAAILSRRCQPLVTRIVKV
jgi:hypothetical protein